VSKSIIIRHLEDHKPRCHVAPGCHKRDFTATKVQLVIHIHDITRGGKNKQFLVCQERRQEDGGVRGNMVIRRRSSTFSRKTGCREDEL